MPRKIFFAKEQIVYGAIKLIERIAKEKELTVIDAGTGHAFENTFWYGVLSDNSGIPSVTASNEIYSIKLRSFWDDPEIDIRMKNEKGEELIVFNYSDFDIRTEGHHTGKFHVNEIRVDGVMQYKKRIREVYKLIDELEIYAREKEIAKK